MFDYRKVTLLIFKVMFIPQILYPLVPWGFDPYPTWESRGTIPKEKLFSAPFCVETPSINQCLYKRTFKKQSTIPQLTPPKFDHTSQIQPQPFRWPVSLTLMTADLSTSLILKDT
jgi:hypothetical protein